MKKIINSLLIISLCFFITGCATLFGRKTHPLPISSSPTGAEVYVNGSKMGRTPLKLDLKADQPYTIEFRLDGYESVVRVVNTKVGVGWVILDILGGLIPIIIDAATGSWYQLDQDSVNTTLVKE